MGEQDKRVLIFGAGAIGGSIGGWIAENYDNIYFLDKGKNAESMKKRGISTYLQGHKDEVVNASVKVVDNISECEPVDIIVIGVKTYSLDVVCQFIKENVKNEPIILTLQNGIDNQQIVPKYFRKVIYGVISYNAWFDEPGVIGYQKKGPIILGTPDNSLIKEMEELKGIFSKGVETVITDHLKDAVYSKMVINLTNSLTTIIGLGYKEVTSMKLFKKVLTNLTYEGVKIVKASGYKECKLGGMPSWGTLWSASHLPNFLTNGIFKKNVSKMVLSSMGQDILQRKGHETELETLNGHLIKMADKAGVNIPYNKAVYELCREEFNKPVFNPIPIEKVWERVQKYL
ncbi:ketopantoate reductase family protein [Vallitalea okinawensis]|uniref:ketopantoate reductase family protein n=1 Tax=Vallitalea okinawensis TaxID=2078660 RepID=UPI000CFAC531|nr:2-dehydropantoate 2-reductase [Vallitalea okinawensis]